ELYRDLDRSDSPSAETVNLQPAVTKLKAKIDIVPGYSFKNGARTGATNTSAGDTVNSNRDVAAPVSVETADLAIGEELKEAARTSSEEVTDDSVVSHVLEGTVVTVAVHASPVADENRYRKTIAAWSSNDPAEIPSFESLTLAEIDPKEPLIADATLYSYENLLIPGRAGRDPIETVTFERNFAVSAKHSLLHFLEPTTVDLAWPARDRELPVADNPAPVAVIDLFMPARFTLSLSLPQTIVVRRRA